MGCENLKKAFSRSLEKLELDYLDLYLIHMPLGDYYGAWRAMEELYEDGKIRAIGVCNFDSARLMDLCYNVKVRPMVNQIERHPHFQRHEELSIMKKLNIQPEGWAPFAEGLKGMFTEPALREIAAKHGKICGTGHSAVGNPARCHYYPQICTSKSYGRKYNDLGFFT